MKGFFFLLKLCIKNTYRLQASSRSPLWDYCFMALELLPRATRIHSSLPASPHTPRISQISPCHAAGFPSSSRVTLIANICCGPDLCYGRHTQLQTFGCRRRAEGCSRKVGLLPRGCCHGRALDQKQNPKESREGLR